MDGGGSLVYVVGRTLPFTYVLLAVVEPPHPREKKFCSLLLHYLCIYLESFSYYVHAHIIDKLFLAHFERMKKYKTGFFLHKLFEACSIVFCLTVL